jgi:hypothetical protein
LRAKRLRAVRILGMAASALSVLAVLVVFGLIVRSERAHDEERCKFVALSQRNLGAVSVREERRSCLPEVEERRYLVKRGALPVLELARKRLPSAQFGAKRYTWTLREDKPERIVIRLDVDGKLASEFFEEDHRR